MGEAARRKAEIAALKARNTTWLATLSSEQRIIANISQATYDRVVKDFGMTEGCYNLAFFLFEHLRRKYGINVKIVVGWVNDGQWDGATSHAWAEYEGKKIDIALHKTSHPKEQPSGDLIILDHVVKRGLVSYQYWSTLPEKAVNALERMKILKPQLSSVIARKDREHQKILLLATTQDGVAEYFRQAPASVNYEALARIIG